MTLTVDFNIDAVASTDKIPDADARIAGQLAVAECRELSRIKRHLANALSKVTSGIAFSFPSPAIPSVGTSGGFTFVLEDRSGSPIEFLAKNAEVCVRARNHIAADTSTTAVGRVK